MKLGMSVMDFTMESLPPPAPLQESYKMGVENPRQLTPEKNAVVEGPPTSVNDAKPDNHVEVASQDHSAEQPPPSDLEVKPKVDLLEAQSALAAVALTSVAVGEYLVVLRSQFDVFVAGEPYPALMVLYNTTSGKVLRRIWNQGWAEH